MYESNFEEVQTSAEVTQFSCFKKSAMKMARYLENFLFQIGEDVTVDLMFRYNIAQHCSVNCGKWQVIVRNIEILNIKQRPVQPTLITQNFCLTDFLPKQIPIKTTQEEEAFAWATANSETTYPYH